MPGSGPNSHRNDMARPAVPPLHGSDLQYGDVSTLEAANRIAFPKEQQPAAPPTAQNKPQTGGRPVRPPTGFDVDPIDFLAGRQTHVSQGPTTPHQHPASAFHAWQKILERLVVGPGSSGLLANAYINQMRRTSHATFTRPATIINTDIVDEGIDVMLTAEENILE